MEKEVCQQINAELLSKFTTNGYSFIFTGVEPPEDKLILRYEDIKFTLELTMDLKTNDDGIITKWSISATINEERKKNKITSR